MRKQQGSAKKSRIKGNKGSVTSGDNSADSKLHRHIKRASRHRM